MVIPDDDNSEVVDDWPLHKTNKVQDTKLIVGACWEGVYSTLHCSLLNLYISWSIFITELIANWINKIAFVWVWSIALVFCP